LLKKSPVEEKSHLTPEDGDSMLHEMPFLTDYCLLIAGYFFM
jgi:hypothetical protein